MPPPAASRRYGPPVEHPAAASLAVRDLLAGPARAGRVVAVFPTCAYADIAGVLVALETHDALRLPCAVVLSARRADSPLAEVRVGDAVFSGARELRLGSVAVRVTRWWPPARPRAAARIFSTSSTPSVSLTQPVLPAPPSSTVRVTDGAGRHPPAGWDSLALRLLGAGPGLTPAGDDVLAGLLLGLAAYPELRDPLAAAVLHQAPSRTTWLSAELLRHAADGHGIPAAVAVADALAGPGTGQTLDSDSDSDNDNDRFTGGGRDSNLDAAVVRLLAVGHTSGRALAQGLLLAAETVARRRSHPVDRRQGVAA